MARIVDSLSVGGQESPTEVGSFPGGHSHARHTSLWVVFLLPMLVFSVLTVVMTYPLVTDIAHSVIRHPLIARSVDVDEERWNLWWFKTAVADRHSNPFYTDMIYYPYRQSDNPISLYFNDMHPLDMFIGMPVLLLNDAAVGPTLAYNLLSMGHMAFAGCAMFWLVFYLTRSMAGGLVAGTVFAFNPLAQYQLQAGHLVLLGTGWLLLHLLFLHRFLYLRPRGRLHLLDGGLAVLFLLTTSFTNWYLTVFLLLMDGLLTLIHVVERSDRWRSTVLRAAGIVLVWAVLASPLIGATVRSMSDSSVRLVSGLDYEVSLSLTPLEMLTVSKDTRVSPPGWNPGTLGYTALLLGALGGIVTRRRAAFWLCLVLVGAVMALGPYLKLDPEALEVSRTTNIPLPYLLFRSLPFMTIARVPRRFVLLADLGLSVLAGFGVAYLMQLVCKFSSSLRRPASQWPAGALAGVLVLLPALELSTLPQPMSSVQISPFFSGLAQEKGDFGILELPVTLHYARDHDRMFNQTVHHKKIVGGYLSRWVYDYYNDPASPFQPILDLMPPPQPDIVPPLSTFLVLNYYNIPYIIHYKQSLGYERPQDVGRVEEYVRRLYPRRSAAIYEDEQLTAYKVPPVAGSGPLVWLGADWYAPENSGNKVWRWSAGGSSLYLINRSPTVVHLSLVCNTLRGEGELEITVNDKALKKFPITSAPQLLDVGRVVLPAGESKVVFRSNVAPVSPSEVGMAAGDDRKLSFVVTELKINP